MIDARACRRALDDRLLAKRRDNRRLWGQATRDADALIECIVRDYQPERIIQWGSVINAERFDTRSDIDIAVEGDFDAETWFRMLGDLWAMTKFPLDIVDLKHIEPEFADIIRLKGKVVYERDQAAD